MTHNSIDPTMAAQLEHEADALVAAEPARAPAPGEGAPVADIHDAGAPVASSWAPIAPGMVSLVALFACPNWNLQPAEQSALADALGPVLDDVFPGGAGDERWAPYIRLGVVASAIVVQRYVPGEGFVPLRAPPAPPARADATA